MEILKMEVCVISDRTQELLAVAENTTDAIVNALMYSTLINDSTWVRDREHAQHYPYLVTLGSYGDWETYLRSLPVDKIRRMFDGDFYFDVFSVVPSEKTT